MPITMMSHGKWHGTSGRHVTETHRSHMNQGVNDVKALGYGCQGQGANISMLVTQEIATVSLFWFYNSECL